MSPRLLALCLGISLLGNAVLAGMLIGRGQAPAPTPAPPPVAADTPALPAGGPKLPEGEFDFSGTRLSDEAWKLDGKKP